MKHTKKPYTFRLEPTLIKQLDSFSGTRTYNVSTFGTFCSKPSNTKVCTKRLQPDVQ